MAIQRVGLVVHMGRPAAQDVARTVHDWCDAHDIPCTDIDVWAKDHQRLGGRAEAEAAGNPDLVVTLGGDGTFLRGRGSRSRAGRAFWVSTWARSASSPRYRRATSPKRWKPSTTAAPPSRNA